MDLTPFAGKSVESVNLPLASFVVVSSLFSRSEIDGRVTGPPITTTVLETWMEKGRGGGDGVVVAAEGRVEEDDDDDGGGIEGVVVAGAGVGVVEGGF